jgi:hypothetical protein
MVYSDISSIWASAKINWRSRCVGAHLMLAELDFGKTDPPIIEDDNHQAISR